MAAVDTNEDSNSQLDFSQTQLKKMVTINNLTLRAKAVEQKIAADIVSGCHQHLEL